MYDGKNVEQSDLLSTDYGVGEVGRYLVVD